MVVDHRKGGCRAVDALLFDSTRPLRLYLALVASFWAIGLALPGQTLERPVYEYMRLAWGEDSWTFLWTVLALSLWWRSIDHTERRSWTVATDIFALAMFTATAAGIIAAKVWPWPAATAADLACVAAALWVLVRTLAAEPDRVG